MANDDVIFFVIAVIGVIFELGFIYSKYNNIIKSLNEQCKDLTYKKAVREFKLNHWLEDINLTSRIFYIV